MDTTSSNMSKASVVELLPAILFLDILENREGSDPPPASLRDKSRLAGQATRCLFPFRALLHLLLSRHSSNLGVSAYLTALLLGYPHSPGTYHREVSGSPPNIPVAIIWQSLCYSMSLLHQDLKELSSDPPQGLPSLIRDVGLGLLTVAVCTCGVTVALVTQRRERSRSIWQLIE
ncbi:hypothetical protein RRG08_009849 [Elysia crispata]|uniref:Uncharacterized protein n=1 Tax=Elysia crispata TaxID=231223 RepID=A0AAE0Z5J3_9GAST|nr:hypothetical protein RRG08_009849 [Elysia crispata]